MTIAVEIRHLQVDRAALARLRCAVRECLSFARPPAAAEPVEAPATFELAAAWLPAPWTPPVVEDAPQACATCGDQMPERIDIFGRCPECALGRRLIDSFASPVGRRRRPAAEPAGPFLPIREHLGAQSLWTYTEPEASQ
jgi:hypothetical protein